MDIFHCRPYSRQGRIKISAIQVKKSSRLLCPIKLSSACLWSQFSPCRVTNRSYEEWTILSDGAQHSFACATAAIWSTLKHLKSLYITALAFTTVGLAQARAADMPGLETLGRLIQTNTEGNSRYYGTTKFTPTGSHRSYINKFARRLAKNPEDIRKYEDVLRMAIYAWEGKTEVQPYLNDLAGAMAFYTVTNVGVAHNENSKDYLIPNLVDQYRTRLASRTVARMSNEKKEDMYDYMITEAMYMEVLIASEPDMQDPSVLDQVKALSAENCQDLFGVRGEVLSVTESGLVFD